jgi:cellulose synthase (UDP-forming)
MLAWVVLSVPAWSWWLQPRNSGSLAAFVVNTGVLAIDAFVLPLWFFFWIWRMRRPDPELEVPELRAAMVVTKAPSEPWPVVRETLEAMLSQDFPYPYDVWLADEAPVPETVSWCAAHDVRISSRQGVDEYHRPTWPRRTRCKEGNLAYFYDHWGYDNYDVVSQLDADHVPEPDYLSQMVIPFTDPDVGYVAAPSMCDRNAERSWSARARLYAEAVLHGPMQAGHSGGFAPSAIGSHYAVRTAALREVGGLGPELAEDFTTSLMMSSHRWQGVFAIEAHAHGDGPETVADCITQEFQWSRSMMNVLLGVNHRYWRGLSRPAKLRLGFCQIWYPLFALLMVASVTIPLVAIVSRTPPMQVSLGSFYLHFAPPTLVLLLVVVWLRRMNWLRPTNVKTISWEIALFQLIRWPWVLLGCVHAIAGRIARREFSFKVTPKGLVGPRPLPVRVVIPYLLIAAISAMPAILRLNAGRAHGYYTLALINVGVYLTAALAVVALHIHDHPPIMRATVLRNSLGKLAATAGIALLTIAAILGSSFALTPAPARSAPLSRATARPSAAAPARAAGLWLGVVTQALADNSTRAWTAPDLSEVASFERSARARASIVMWYADWQHGKVNQAQLQAVRRRGSIPEITWEPWDYLRGRHQPRYTLASIIAGRHDAYIRSWAVGLRAYGNPVLLRFAQEMNGGQYPWAEGVNGNRPGQFVKAWRHVYNIFKRAHARNVRWVWSELARGGAPLDAGEYPGDAYVNIVGLSGFNGGSSLRGWGGWRSFGGVFDHSLAMLKAIAPRTPVQISEVGTARAGGSVTGWVTDMFHDLARHPEVRSLVWFDVRKQADWRITSPRLAAAFAAGLRWLRTHGGSRG